jgi:Carbohydrate-selective porin, OprB family
MSGKAKKTLHRSPQSHWSIFFRNSLLLKIVVWLGSLSSIGSAGVAWADLPPIYTFPTASRAILPGSAVSLTGTRIVKPVRLKIDHASLPIDRQQSSAQVIPAAPQPKIHYQPAPQHIDLLTADNYIVGVLRSTSAPITTKESIDLHVPAPLTTAIPDRLREVVLMTKSQVQPNYVKPVLPATSLPTTIRPQRKPLAGLKSTLVTPMKPRLTAGKSTAKSPKTSETRFGKANATRSTIERLTFADTGTSEQMLDKSIDEITTTQNFEHLTKILDQKFTAKPPSSPTNPQPNPEQPKQQIALTKDTQITFGVLALEANDFTDTINPLFDGKENGMISRFGSRSGIYYLVAGSGAGIRHQFSPNLEGSVGLLFRSSADTSSNTKSGGSSNSKLNDKKSSDSSNGDSGLIGGSIGSSYGTIAQLTYVPSQNVKFGITYVHGYNVNPEIGSEKANQTDGINSALGLQTFWKLDSNLALGGWVGFNQNSNVELNKNIFTWAITAGIPDLGGKGNLAGIIVGQEPRVIAASNLAAEDTGSSWHLEGFYQIKISDDFSITPAIIYLTGSNIDNVKSDAGSIIGAIGITIKF